MSGRPERASPWVWSASGRGPVRPFSLAQSWARVLSTIGSGPGTSTGDHYPNLLTIEQRGVLPRRSARPLAAGTTIICRGTRQMRPPGGQSISRLDPSHRVGQPFVGARDGHARRDGGTDRRLTDSLIRAVPCRSWNPARSLSVVTMLPKLGTTRVDSGRRLRTVISPEPDDRARLVARSPSPSST